MLAPYGLAALATLLLSRLMKALSTALSSSATPNRRHPALDTRPLALLRRYPTFFIAAVAVAITALHLLLGLACLLAMLWWELWSGYGFLDGAWIHLAMWGYPTPDRLPPSWWLVGQALLLWWRGSALSREENDFPQLSLRAFWGAAILAALMFVGRELPLDPTVSSWSLAVYLLFGLVALAASRLEMAQQERVGQVDGGWGLRSMALALLLLAAGFGVAFLLLYQLEQTARWLESWLLEVLLPLVIQILLWIAHLLGLDKPPDPMPMTPVPQPMMPTGEPMNLFTLPEWLREAMRLLFNLTWIGLILTAIYLWVRQWYRHRDQRAGGGAVRESMPWSFHIDLRRLLRQLLRALLARWPALDRWLRRPVPIERRARTVRELYRRLLAWGAGRGCGREPWSTPSEYQDSLSARWPQVEADFHCLTESYLRARYGNQPIDEKEMRAALDCWLRIELQ